MCQTSRAAEVAIHLTAMTPSQTNEFRCGRGGWFRRPSGRTLPQLVMSKNTALETCGSQVLFMILFYIAFVHVMFTLIFMKDSSFI